jgi:ribokinase
MKPILVIGDLYSETQYFVEKLPGQDQFIFAHGATTMVGGKVVNAARILARLGNQVSFYGHVGNDDDGETAEHALAKYAIHSQLQKKPNETTGKITVTTDREAKSSIVLFMGANKTITQDSIATLKTTITPSFIYAATSLELSALYALIAYAAEESIPLFLDVPNQHSLLDLTKLANVDFFSLNRQEIGLLLKKEMTTIDEALAAIKQLRETIKGTIILTLDKDGCVLLEKNSSSPTHIKAGETHAVDETGAGDIFKAVFVDTFLKTNDMHKAVEKSLRVATRSTEIKGVDATITTVSLD